MRVALAGMPTVTILGGTGGLGQALALRLCAAGESVVIGSRSADKAEACAAQIRGRLPDARVVGLPNARAVEASGLTVLSVPFAGAEPLLPELERALTGRVLIDTVVPLRVHAGFAELLPLPGVASVGEWLQAALPAVRVVSAFKTVPAAAMADLGHSVSADVLVCGEDAAARAEVAALVGRIAGLRAVDAGTIRNARYVEGITALLLNLNARHRVRASIVITGLDGAR
jgi:NADPH-dependent F420 reductase